MEPEPDPETRPEERGLDEAFECECGVHIPAWPPELIAQISELLKDPSKAVKSQHRRPRTVRRVHPLVEAHLEESKDFTRFPGSWVEPGWASIVHQLAADLVATGIGFRFVQIKEKFGVLRVYVDIESTDRDDVDAIRELVDAAELRSASTCQTCGRPGELRDNGRLATTCEDHR